MKNLKLEIKLIFLAIIFCGIFGLAKSSQAAEYYVSPTGSGTNCLTGSPCSLATGLGKLTTGSTDTLYLKDGMYNDSITVPVSGDASHYITIKAENDGMAIVDGQSVRVPLTCYNKAYINIIGLVFKNSSQSVIYVNGGSSNVTLQRVSGYTAANDNTNIFEISDSSHILLEDCAASGNARKMYLVYHSSYVTVRRCWGRWTGYIGTGGGVGAVVSVYDASNNVIENCIGLQDTTNRAMPVTGIGLVAQSSGASINNHFYGNVAYNFPDYSGIKDEGIQTSGNWFFNNVSLNSNVGFAIENDSSDISQNNTSINSTGNNYTCIISGEGTSTCTIKNCNLSGGGTGLYSTGTLQNTYDNYYALSRNYGGNAAAGTGDQILNPAYDTTTYGKGAYLMVPTALQGRGEGGADIGAEALYGYQDGTLTNTALWPWPMEQRICNETGYSATYEDRYTGCASGGGIWKTLDGVYSDTTPPAAPSGLSVQ